MEYWKPALGVFAITPLLHCSIIHSVPMLIFDELKKNDPQLRLLAVVLAGGLFVLLAGCGGCRSFPRANMKAFGDAVVSHRPHSRRAREILDRNGRVLAENRPRYSLSLTLMITPAIRRRLRCGHRAGAGRPETAHCRAGENTWPVADQGRTKTILTRKRTMKQLREQSRFQVADSVVEQVGQRLGQPLVLDPATFNATTRRGSRCRIRAAQSHRTQIARFEEQNPGAWVWYWTCSPLAVIRMA